MKPSPLVAFCADRKLWWLVASAAAAVILGFIAIPDVPAITFVSKAGFWLVLAAFGIFSFALWRTWREEWTGRLSRPVDWVSVAVVAAGGVVLLVHETFGFKIIMDEIMLLGTSMSMHLDKTVLVPVRGNDIQGTFVILDGMMDKRPLFFPFLVSLLHDLTGYRPANAFVLNAVLTFVFLTLVCLLGRSLAGRAAGWLGVALLAGLPLLAHNATGGGFELLNLVMILATLLLGVRFLRRRDASALTAFCYSALLLAQVRYESVVFLLPVAALVLWVWWREGRVILSWPVVLAPLLMVHYPLQHRIFDLRASAWELKAGFDQPFSLGYFGDGLFHAANFFFAKPTDQPNSLVLTALGCIAVPFFVLLTVKRLRALGAEPPVVVATTVFAVGFAVQFVLMMCYLYHFDEVVTRRLSLPTCLGLVIAILAVVQQFSSPVVVRSLLAVAGLGLLASGVPSMAAHAYSQEYLPGKETAWRRQFIAEQPRRDFLAIDNDSILWIAHGVSATPMLQARKNRAALVFHLRNRTFADVYVFQRFNIDPDTGRMTLREGDELPPDFVLEPVREERLQVLTLSRLSRLKEIREGGVNVARPDPVDHPVPKQREEIEKMRRAYLENFVRMLP